jgi:hypothetical protein
MSRKPRKPVRYPKKLRATLERIQATADSAQDDDEKEFDPFRTFARSFLPRNSVEGMYARVDEDLHRITMEYHLRSDSGVYRITVPPPWDNAEPGT